MQIKKLSDEALRATVRSLVERRRLYAEWGYSSLYAYVTTELKFSEGSAMRRIQAMRLLREMPEIEAKVETGALSLTVLSQAQPVIKNLSPEKKQEVIAKLNDCSSRQADRVLAEVAPREAKESSRSIDGKNLQVTLILTPELQAKLKQLADKEGTTGWAELLERMADRLLKPKPTPATPPPAPAVTATRHIPLLIQRFVRAHDKHRCTFRSPDGRICASIFRLELDHKIPFAMGGTHDPGNLTLRCRAHNLLGATRACGPGITRLWTVSAEPLVSTSSAKVSSPLPTRTPQAQTNLPRTSSESGSAGQSALPSGRSAPRRRG